MACVNGNVTCYDSSVASSSYHASEPKAVRSPNPATRLLTRLHVEILSTMHSDCILTGKYHDGFG